MVTSIQLFKIRNMETLCVLGNHIMHAWKPQWLKITSSCNYSLNNSLCLWYWCWLLKIMQTLICSKIWKYIKQCIKDAYFFEHHILRSKMHQLSNLIIQCHDVSKMTTCCINNYKIYGGYYDLVMNIWEFVLRKITKMNIVFHKFFFNFFYLILRWTLNKVAYIWILNTSWDTSIGI